MRISQKTIAAWSALACFMFSLCPPAVQAQSITSSASQGGISWQVNTPNDGISLRVSQPDGTVFEQTFTRGQSPAFVSPSGRLPDGQYTYELRLAPLIASEVRQRAEAAESRESAAKFPAGEVATGTFRVLNGTVLLPDGAAAEAGALASQSSDAAAPQEIILNDVTIQGQNTTLTFDDTSTATGFSANDWRIRANDTASGGADKLSIEDLTGGTTPFTILGGAPNDSLTVNSIGRVGIGTILPAANLHILKSGLDTTLRLEQTGTLSFPAQTWTIVGSDLGFQVNDTTNGGSLLRIRTNTGTNAGFVGLGTGNPQGKLHVFSPGNQLSIFQSSDNNAVQFRLQTDSTNRRFVALNSAGTQQSQLVFGDNGGFDFLGATVADVRMKLLANGNVGIGTSTPDQRLSVNGNASKLGGGSWATFSDERLKNVKGEFTSGLEAVMKLQPIRYEYKDDNAIGLKSEGEHIGFGAAAVSEVIPEAVTRSENGYLMVDNDPILWTMLNAIKEQNAQITDLKDQVKRLQAEVVLQASTKKPANRKVAKSSR